MARSAPRLSATVSPVGRSGRTDDVAYVDACLVEEPGEEGAEVVVADGRGERDRPTQPGQAVCGDRGRAADHQRRRVEELLDLDESGDDVAAQDQVGVGVTDHEHPRGTGAGRGLLVDGHRSIVADPVHICPETINVIALS